MKNKKRGQLVSMVGVLLCALLLTTMLATPMLAQTQTGDTEATLPEGAVSSASALLELAKTNDGLIALDDDVRWVQDTPVNVFDAFQVNGENKIAPGISGDYEFTLKNSENFSIQYTLKIWEENEHAIPVKFRLARDTKTNYVLGETGYVAPTTEDIYEVTATLTPGQQHDYFLDWTWIFYENDLRDTLDTSLGERAAVEDLEYKLHFSIVAEGDNTCGCGCDACKCEGECDGDCDCGCDNCCCTTTEPSGCGCCAACICIGNCDGNCECTCGCADCGCTPTKPSGCGCKCKDCTCNGNCCWLCCTCKCGCKECHGNKRPPHCTDPTCPHPAWPTFPTCPHPSWPSWPTCPTKPGCTCPTGGTDCTCPTSTTGDSGTTTTTGSGTGTTTGSGTGTTTGSGSGTTTKGSGSDKTTGSGGSVIEITRPSQIGGSGTPETGSTSYMALRWLAILITSCALLFFLLVFWDSRRKEEKEEM